MLDLASHVAYTFLYRTPVLVFAGRYFQRSPIFTCSVLYNIIYEWRLPALPAHRATDFGSAGRSNAGGGRLTHRSGRDSRCSILPHCGPGQYGTYQHRNRLVRLVAQAGLRASAVRAPRVSAGGPRAERRRGGAPRHGRAVHRAGVAALSPEQLSALAAAVSDRTRWAKTTVSKKRAIAADGHERGGRGGRGGRRRARRRIANRGRNQGRPRLRRLPNGAQG